MKIRNKFDKKVADNIDLIDEMRFRLPDGEITDYGYAVATRCFRKKIKKNYSFF